MVILVSPAQRPRRVSHALSPSVVSLMLGCFIHYHHMIAFLRIHSLIIYQSDKQFYPHIILPIMFTTWWSYHSSEGGNMRTMSVPNLFGSIRAFGSFNLAHTHPICAHVISPNHTQSYCQHTRFEIHISFTTCLFLKLTF